MKSISVGEGYIQRWSCMARQVIAIVAMACATIGAYAQSIAVTTLAGTNATLGSSNSAPITFNNPYGVAVDANGNAYIADTSNHVIRKITAAGVVTTLVGSAGTAGYQNDATANALAARFRSPKGIAINATGDTLYLADTGNNVIRVIALSGIGGSVTGVTTLTGPAPTDGTTAAAAGTSNVGVGSFNGPIGLAFDSTGPNLYVADTGNQLIRKIVITGPAVSTVAGLAGNSTFANGDSSTATFSTPFSVAVNSAGDTLYVADFGNHAVRKIALSPAVAVTTYAGTPGTPGFIDNAAGTSAAFRNPSGLVIDALGNLYVVDFGNNAIRTVAAAVGNAVSTVAGPTATGTVTAGVAGSSDGTGTAARFTGPIGIALKTVSGTQFEFIADTNNQLIRKAAVPVLPSVGSPSNQTASAGANGVTFSATVTGGWPTPTLQWQRQPGGTGSFVALSNNSNYSGTTTGTLTVNGVAISMNGDKLKLVATNSSGTAESATPATLTVNQAPQFSASSATFTGVVGQALTGASVSATGTATITYGVVSGSLGIFSLSASTGAITGTPGSTADATTVTIRATNSVGTADQTVTINVLPPSSAPVIQGSGQPQNYSVPISQTTASFSVTATANPAITGYQWYKAPASSPTSFASLGSGDATYGGTQTATLAISNVTSAMNGDVFQVTVTNSQGTTTSSPATLTVVQAPAITSTSAATFVVGQSNTFTFTATGAPVPTITISPTSYPTGVTFSTPTLSGTPTSTDGSPFTYTVTATNSGGSVTQTFTLTVSTAPASPTIATQPSNVTAQAGANAVFTAAASGSPAPTLRWQRQPSGTSGFIDLSDDGTYSGTTTGTLTVTGVAAGMTADQFRLVATNTNGSITSSTAILTVNIGTAITTFAGQPGTFGSTDATGTSARFNTPAAIASDRSGNFYVADAANNVIRKITAAGVVTTFAGTAGSSGNVDGTGTAARFNGPSALGVDSLGDVYVADTYNQTVRLITPGGVVTTVAGLANNSGSSDGVGSAARFAYPSGIAVDAAGVIYVADTSNHTIRRIQTNGTVSTFAGAAGVSGAGDNATGTLARFYFPKQMALDSAGNLFVADSFNDTVRKVTPAGAVSTIAGGAGLAGVTDANGTAARFNQPQSVAVDATGNLFVADTNNDTIRKIATNGDVTTLAGSATIIGSADGIGSAARFYQPFGVTIDPNGNLYIADTRNNTIRRSGTTAAPGITTQPANAVGVVGGAVTFTVVATGVPAPSYQWQWQGAGTTGFVNLTNNSTYSGVNTATLTVSNLFTTNSGDQFRVVVNNGISPTATSDVATLTMGTAPTFTTADNVTFQAGVAGNFVVGASGTPTPTLASSGTLPSWLTFNASTGALSGTAPIDASGTYTFTLVANNGLATTQSFTLTVQPGAPIITAQPAGVAVNQGGTATFAVTATGASPFTYQWRRNGISISGATNSSLTVSNVQPAAAGNYSVVVTNAAGVLASNNAALVVNTLPTFTASPQPQTVLAGSTVTFSVTAGGGSSFTYQWRKNGVAIAGATNSSLTLTAVTAADVGSYDVLVGNSVGTSTSSIAQLTIATAPFAPVVTSQPRSQSALVGSSVTLSIGGSAVPAPTFQWRKNGVSITNATGQTYVLGSVQASDAGSYDVIVTNSSGTITSAAATLRVIGRSWAGTYFGQLAGNLGSFALYVRDDNTGVFLAYLPGSTAAIVNLNVVVNDAGQFSFTQASTAAAAAVDSAEPSRAAALSAVTLNGTIGSDGTLSGSVSGGANASLSGTRAADTGPTQPVAGFYQAGAGSSGATSYTIAGANSVGFVVVQAGSSADGGVAGVTSSGQVAATTARSIISETITPSSGTVTGTSSGGVAASFAGGSDVALSRQRLVNISSRARVGTGDSVAIAGFVISGTDSKPVLIRAVGPTLSVFGLTGVLATPKLDLYRGNTVIATNVGVASSANVAAIAAAGKQAGAFDLGTSGNDSAILITLAPGAYTAQVSSTTSTPGTALVEVYDLSAPAAGQKLLDISTRAQAGTADATLIAGFVVPSGPAKRVLIRGIGPGLAQFGLTGTLAQPTLTLLSGSSIVASNTNVATSADAAAIASGALQVGAFTLASGDSAMIVTLAPGNFTAQVTGANGGTGLALVEVYELP